MENERNIFLSIAICTYNRADILALCLESLSGQKNVPGKYEILLIDNNSSDHTKSVFEKYLKKLPNLKYFKEKKQGLSHARNRAMNEAKGTFIAYLDDDAKAEKVLVCKINNFIKRHPDSKIFGGPTKRFGLVRIPEWLPEELGSHDMGDTEKKLNFPDEYLIGCLMVIDLNTLKKIGGFDPNLGMNENEIAYGEEIKLQKQILDMNFPIWYDPSIEVQHLLQEERMSLKWHLHSFYKSGKALENTTARSFTHIYLIASFGYNVIKSIVLMFNPKLMPMKRRIYLALKGLMISSGALVAKLRKGK